MKSAGPRGRMAAGLRLVVGLVQVLGLVFTSGRALGQDQLLASDLGQGGAHLANPRTVSTILDAPATLGLVTRYHLGFSGRLGPLRERQFAIGAMDSGTTKVAAGFAVSRMVHEDGLQAEDLPGWIPEGEVIEEQEARLRVGAGVALPLLDRVISLGIAGWYDNRGVPDGNADHGGNITASFAANLADERVIFSAQGENLLPWRLYYAPLKATSGLRLQVPEAAAIEADISVPMGATRQTVGANVGLELIAAKLVAVRGGWERASESGEDRICGGLGLVSPRGGIDYGMRFPLGRDPTERLDSWHSLSLRINLE